MILYSSFTEFCEKNNLSKAEGIEILEKEIDKLREGNKNARREP